MADNARHTTYYIPETVFGTIPTDPAMSRLRITGNTLGLNKSSSISEEQTPDRQIKDFRHGTEETGGGLPVELSYGSQDDLLEAALGGTWGNTGYAGTAVAVVEDPGGDQLVLASGVWADFGNFYAGQSITVAGFTDGANNATFEVLSVSGATLTVTATNLVAEAAGDAVTVDGDEETLTVGVTRRSFSILRHFSDLTDTQKPYHWFTGQEVNTFTLSVTPDARVTGSFDMMGQTVDPKNDTEHATILGSGSLGSPSTTKVFDAFSGTVTIGGVANSCVTEISLSLENGLENRFVVGSRTSKRPTIGRSNLTGNITVYFEDASLLEAFYDEVASSLEFDLVDPAGNRYTFILPEIYYTGGQPDSQGTTGSVTVSLPFQAVYNSDAGTNIIIERNPV
jgi:Phage tail tube protein